MNIPKLFEDLMTRLSHFPWRTTAAVLWERFREDRLGLVASSLTFTTIISLVPLMTVGLAIFSAFPVFAQMEVLLQKWLLANLIPENISKQVLNYLNQFSNKANSLGGSSLGFVLISAIALTLTIDRALNSIWRVNKNKAMTHRVLIYWALLTLGPLLLGASLTLSSLALASARGWFDLSAGFGKAFFAWLEIILLMSGMAALYKYVPKTKVAWSHAWVGALFAGAGIEICRRVLSWYFSTLPAYATLYGAFSAVPIFMVWIYLAWLMVLFGAVVTAYSPSLLSGVARPGDTPGWNFQLALEVLRELHAVKWSTKKGLSISELANTLRVSDLQIEPVFETLTQLDWIAPLAEDADRLVLLINPERTYLAPLSEALLLGSETLGSETQEKAHEILQNFKHLSAWPDLMLSEVMSGLE